MKTLVVTGGIGSGKSLVCSHLEKKGIPVYDSDSRTRRIYDLYPALIGEVEQEFGRSFRLADGGLDRRALAAEVFSDRRKLAALENLVYPYVLDDFLGWRASFDEDAVPYVVFESAVFLEKPFFHHIADKVLFVSCPESVRLERAMARDCATADEIRGRMDAQHLDPALADVVLENDSDIKTLFEKTDHVVETIWDNKTNKKQS